MMVLNSVVLFSPAWKTISFFVRYFKITLIRHHGPKLLVQYEVSLFRSYLLVTGDSQSLHVFINALKRGAKEWKSETEQTGPRLAVVESGPDWSELQFYGPEQFTVLKTFSDKL